MDMLLFSSQDENAAPDVASLASSPPPSNTSSTRPKKPPPITPRRFTKFFTPRTRSSTASVSKSGRQLRDITRNGANRGHRSSRNSSLGKRVLFEEFDDVPEPVCVATPQSRKRRKGLLTPESSPFLASSPLKRRGSLIQVLEDVAEEDDPLLKVAKGRRLPTLSPTPEPVYPRPLRRVAHASSTARLISREFGGAVRIGRGRVYDHCVGGTSQTSHFYSDAEHRYALQAPRMPYCVASGHHNDLAAIGSESGGVTVFNTTIEASKQATATMAVVSHNNAVMDVAFSHDDSLLATASGDQHCHILDVRTMTPKLALRGHTSTVKQVRFQSGNDSILASSSRDGSIQLWDLRCRGADYVINLADPADPEDISRRTEVRLPHLPAHKTILSAHYEADSASDASKERTNISITSLAFLSYGRDHLLLSGSETSTHVRLWDIRGRFSHRKAATPVSCTALPAAHNSHRHYGINSIVVGSDQSRFYALSKDSTVYAYSTNHLVLGAAPELSTALTRQSKHSSTGGKGLGPLYGFRHSSFTSGSFYVKAAIRKATDDQPELLAVGSSGYREDRGPVLFPTDELLLSKPARKDEDTDESTSCSSPPIPQRPNVSRSTSSTAIPLRDNIPIYEHGTPLIRGHVREVTGLTWTRKGELVSLSDDYTCRVWKEGPRARELRMAGEAEGKRWGCGWADVRGEVDEDD